MTYKILTKCSWHRADRGMAGRNMFNTILKSFHTEHPTALTIFVYHESL